MTLVAAWKEHDTSYLVGDVLVSTRDDFDFKEDHFSVPTRDDLIEILPRAQGVRISGAWQKIYKVSDSFAIGWAGNRHTAAVVITDLFSRFQGQQPSLKDVRDSLAKAFYDGNSACLLVGLLIENGATQCFRWASPSPEYCDAEEEIFEGSGGEYLREILKPASETGKEPLVNSALGKIANLLGHEIYSGTNLERAFGGWYELIYYDEGLRVLPSATFIFLSAKEGENGLEVVPSQRYLKSQYGNGVLQTMMVSDINGWPPQRTLHYAYPILQERPNIDGEGPALSLLSEYYAVYIDVQCRDGLQGEHVTTFDDGQKSSTLKVSQSPDGFEVITLNRQIFSKVVEMIKNRNPDRSAYPTRKHLTK